MWEDSIVKEVRQARFKIEKECDEDFRKIYERALEIQKQVAQQQSPKMSSGEKLLFANLGQTLTEPQIAK